MRKILTIALREYKAMVGTKAFMVSIIMMPVLMLGGLLAIELLKNSGETKTLKIAVVDPSQKFLSTIELAAKGRNSRVQAAEQANDSAEGFPSMGREIYQIESLIDREIGDEIRLELSDRIRDGDLYAFVEIPSDISEIPISTPTEPSSESPIRFYSQNSSLSEARNWISQVINLHLTNERLKAANVDPETVRIASAQIPVTGVGLVEESTLNGQTIVLAAAESNPVKEIFLPMAVMMMMFMVIFMASQPMLESVLEEKSQRIAEVLLGSANPFQLMLGKLTGTVAGSLTVFGIYLSGMLAFAIYRGWSDQIPFELIPWFIVFQIVGVLFYASIFMAVGASVSQLKEAQSMLLPVWMLLMSPMFVWIFIVRDPTGSMATGFSLFPPATPTTMMLRMATGVSIPIWQPIVGLVLTLAMTLAIVVLAGRIFRVGILWQGKTPKISEILKWAVKG